MADIHLKCSKCNASVTVSEYVSATDIPCPSCGTSIPLPVREKKSGVTLRTASAVAPPAPSRAQTDNSPIPTRQVPIPTAAVVTDDKKKPDYLRRDEKRVQKSRTIACLSWLVFIVLGAAMYYIRWVPHSLPASVSMDTVKFYGLIAIAVAYLLLIIIAIKDNMFDGLLSIVVPFYPFYYLFMVSDAVFLRAIIAALFVGFGYDFAMFLQVQWTILCDWVNFKIRTA